MRCRRASPVTHESSALQPGLRPASKDSSIMSEKYALSGHESRKLLGLCGRRTADSTSVTGPRCWENANRFRPAWRNIRPASCVPRLIGNVVAAAHAAYYTISSSQSGDSPRAAASPSRGRGPRGVRGAIDKGVCSKYDRRPSRAATTSYAKGSRDQGGFRLTELKLAAAADLITDRGTRHGAGAPSRFSAGARGSQGKGREHRAGDCFSAAARISRTGFILLQPTR